MKTSPRKIEYGLTPKSYDHLTLEKKWQKEWTKSKLYKTAENSKKEKFYVLDMFPYPSGEGLHVGHPKGYIATDIVSRMKRMQGKNILHPMGFDAFGLPAENYALKTQTHPEIAVRQNIARYKKQLEILGFDYDWSHEINTTDPKYYKWTQWIFLQLLKKGLAYESYEPINWCPTDKTGLANEDIEDGRCERCGTLVEKKPMRQWVLKTTDYAERLLNDLDGVDKPTLAWPESIKELQRNWIGKSEGAEISFPLKRKFNFVLLHGFTATPDDDFHPWLKNKLEAAGYSVQVPVLPGTKKPTEDEQVRFVLENVNFDENTILLGHSLGSVVALKVLEKLDKKIAGLITVGGFIDTKFKDHDRSFDKTFNWNFDFAKIKAKSSFFRILHDINDVAITDGQADRLADALNVKVERVIAKDSHFTAPEELEVLRVIVPSINIFTTRPDTIFGATYLVLAPEHPWVKENLEYLENKKEVEDYANRSKNKTEMERTDTTKEKTGMELKGLKAVNPANNEEIPIWISDYILADYGTGAVMAVPAHDERDFAFARKFDLPIKETIKGGNTLKEAYTGNGIIVNSGQFNDKNSEAVKKEITEFVGGRMITKYKLRDWVFSRQRYWGEPIPVIHCNECGIVPVPEKDLPVKLPKVKSYEPTDTGESPLAGISKWVNVKCPKCKSMAKRETNTMPQWAGSSWYYLRYMDPKNNKNLVDPKKEKYWAPVDLYVGGAEHATRHLIYARFWHKFLYDIGVVSTIEPFTKLQNVGIIMGEDGRKMSKRFGNVINPDDIIKTYGADTLRIYEMFMGPFDQQIAWDTSSITGSRRFIEKIWRLKEKIQNTIEENDTSSIQINKVLNKTIQKVTADIENLHFNTAISSLMIAVNEIEKIGTLSKNQFETLLLILAPFAPHVSEELFSSLGNKKSIHLSKWPTTDHKFLIEEDIKIIVQINGKVRESFMVKSGVSKEDLEKKALELPDIKKWLSNKDIIKIIVVPNKIVSIVVSEIKTES